MAEQSRYRLVIHKKEEARKVDEIQALMVDPPYQHSTHKGLMRTHPKFLPKIVTEFHLSQPIHLPVFFPKPHTSKSESLLHTLDMKRALAYYLNITKEFQISPMLHLAKISFSHYFMNYSELPPP